MNIANMSERKSNVERKARFLEKMKKVLFCTCVSVGGAVLLVALYQLLEVLLIGAILFVAWFFPKK